MNASRSDGVRGRRSLVRRAGLLGAAALLISPIVLVGCSSSSSSDASSAAATAAGAASGAPATASGGILKAALTGEPDSLDPAISSVYTGAQVYDNIFSKLLTADTAGEFVPRLATAWTQTDPQTWTFDLVDNAYFHNGEKFTSADVKYTFERILDPATASAYAALFYRHRLDRDADADPGRRSTSRRPFGPFLSNLANNGEIVNQKAIESGDPARNPVGTGPFEFVEWVQGDHITVKKFDKLLRGRPAARRPGRLQVPAGGPGPHRCPRLGRDRLGRRRAPAADQRAEGGPAIHASSRVPMAGIPNFLSLNTAKAPFDNPKVRQAVAWALDRTAIRDLAYVRERRGRHRGGPERFHAGSTARTPTQAAPISRRPRPS